MLKVVRTKASPHGSSFFMELFLLILNTVLLVATFFFIKVVASYLKKQIEATKREYGVGFPQEPTAKNNIDSPKAEFVQFDENRPLDIPKDMKIEVEGGDSVVPIEYQ